MEQNALRDEIVLIGPVSIGKTTVSKTLAEKTGLPRVSMDDLLFGYMAEVGFCEDHWKEIIEKQGKTAGYRYLKVFGSHAVKRLLESHENCIFDFGGGGVTGEFPDEFSRITEALKGFRNVVFLVPSPRQSRITPPGWTILERTVYTKGKTQEDIADGLPQNQQ